MKKYEYKFIKIKTKLGLNYDKKLAETENEWNQLGLQGWKFCTLVNGAVVFIKETDSQALL